MGWNVFGRKQHERAGHALYGAAVAAARDPHYYVDLAVPDTLDGRFDMVSLHAFLVIRRLQALPPPGPDLAQAVFDAMFSDMDVTLREMGVGDLGVSRRVKAMWEGFHGRSAAYQTALATRDEPALAAALARNVWRDPAAPRAAGLAALAMAQDRHLATQPLDVLRTGKVSFIPISLGQPA